MLFRSRIYSTDALSEPPPMTALKSRRRKRKRGRSIRRVMTGLTRLRYLCLTRLPIKIPFHAVKTAEEKDLKETLDLYGGGSAKGVDRANYHNKVAKKRARSVDRENSKNSSKPNDAYGKSRQCIERGLRAFEKRTGQVVDVEEEVDTRGLKPPHAEIPGIQVHPTLGDGCCGLHAVNCLADHSNYATAMKLAMAAGTEDQFRIKELKPRVEQFLASRPLLHPSELKALQNMLKSNIPPKELHYKTIAEYYKYLLPGENLVIINDSQNEPGHPITLVTGAMFEQNVKHWDLDHTRFISLQKRHFRYVTYRGDKAKDSPGALKALVAKIMAETNIASPNVPQDVKTRPTKTLKTGFHMTDGKLSYNHSCEHKLGPEFAAVLESEKCNVSPTARSYPHPGLRWIADHYNLEMLLTAFQTGFIVIEHAAKYGKTLAWLRNMPELLSRYRYTRPKILGLYDEKYRNQHPEGDDPWLDLDFEGICRVLHLYEWQNIRVVHVINDAIYYQGIKDKLSLVRPGDYVFFSAGIYPRENGRYHYYDNEGHVDVTANIHNKPTSNGPGYKHPPLWLEDEFRPTSSPDHVINLVHKIPTGLDTAHGWYQMYHDTRSAAPLLDMNGYNIPRTIDRALEDRTIFTGPRQANITTYATQDIVTSEVFVDMKYLRYVESKALIEPDVRNSKRQCDFVRRQFDEERIAKRLPAFDHKYSLGTYLYWAEQANRSAALIAQVNHAPLNHDPYRKEVVIRLTWWRRLLQLMASPFDCCRHDDIEHLVDTKRTRQARGYHPDVKQAMRLEPFGYGGGTPRDKKKTSDQQTRTIKSREVCEPIPVISTHFLESTSSRHTADVLNSNVVIRRRPPAISCTCSAKPTYEYVLPVEPPTHFGRCMHNTRAALHSRMFNTTAIPQPEVVVELANVVKEWIESNKIALSETAAAFTERDLSIEAFLESIKAESPRKYAEYAAGLEEVITLGKIRTVFELMVKLDEIHYGSKKTLRPRALFNPHRTLKAIGSYLARLMIRMVKSVEPGFISGYSPGQLGDIFHRTQTHQSTTGGSWYSYDGSSHDAHQHLTLISVVDHVIGPHLINLLFNLPRFPLPSWSKDLIVKALFREEYKFYSADGWKGTVTGTVISGHPSLTTLFNTLRTNLYNKLMLKRIGMPRFIINTAGDDVLVWVSNPELLTSEYPALFGREYCRYGLGQIAKDFQTGPLHTHSFLSKKFAPEIRAFVPLAERLYKAGAVKQIRSIATISDQAASMMITEMDLPPELYDVVAGRFRELLSTVDAARVYKTINSDYGWNLRVRNSTPTTNSIESILRMDSLWQLQLLQSIAHRRVTIRIDPSGNGPTKPRKPHDLTAIRALFTTDQPPVELTYQPILGEGHLLAALDRDLYGGAVSKSSGRSRPDGKWSDSSLKKSEDHKFNRFSTVTNRLENLMVTNNQQRKKANKAKAKVRQRRRVISNPIHIISKPNSNRMHDNESLWLKALHDPFIHRGVRIPWLFPVATQVSTYHGNLSISTNAAGFARVLMYCNKANPGLIALYNDALHTDTVLGASTNIFPAPLGGGIANRVVCAGMKIRSTASMTVEAGYIQSYSSIDSGSYASYDLYRDTPHQRIYSKGTVAHVRYLPSDCNSLDLGSLTTTDNNIGFMIVGAPTQSFFLQYTITIEYTGTSNTDNVPKLVCNGGNYLKVLPLIQPLNAGHPDSWVTSLKQAAYDTGAALLEGGVKRVITYAAGKVVPGIASSMTKGYNIEGVD